MIVKPHCNRTFDKLCERSTYQHGGERKIKQTPTLYLIFFSYAFTVDSPQVAFFEEVVGKIVAAAGKEEDEDGNDGRTKGWAGDKSSPPPVPMEAPPGMAVPCPLARQHPAEVRFLFCACSRSSSSNS